MFVDYIDITDCLVIGYYAFGLVNFIFVILFTIQGMKRLFIRNQNPKQPPLDTRKSGFTAVSNQPRAKHARVDINLDDLPSDPGLRRRFMNTMLMNKFLFEGHTSK